MKTTSQPLGQALLHPLHVAPLGAGLVFALVGGPWWCFPLALVPYLVMVGLAVHRPQPTPRHAALLPRASDERELQRVLSDVQQGLAALDHAIEAGGPSYEPLAAQLWLCLAELTRLVEGLRASGATLDHAAERATRLLARADQLRAAGAPRETVQAVVHSALELQRWMEVRGRGIARLEGLAAGLDAMATRVRVQLASGADPQRAGALEVELAGLSAALESLETPTDFQGGSHA